MDKRKDKLTKKHKDKYGKCDRCCKTKAVSEYWFKGDKGKWTKWWCHGCLEHWMSKNVSLLKYLKKIATKPTKMTTSFLDRFKDRINKFLGINRR